MRCPHCGNTSWATVESNGLASDHPDLTLLCSNRVRPDEWSFSQPANQEDVGADGLAICGYQWIPNEARP